MNWTNVIIEAIAILVMVSLIICIRTIMYKDNNYTILFRKSIDIVKSHSYYSLLSLIMGCASLFLIVYKAQLSDGLKLSTILIVLMFTSLIDLDKKIIPNYIVLSILIYRTILFAYEYYEYTLTVNERENYIIMVMENSNNLLYKFINSFGFTVAMSLLSGLICLLVLLAASVVSKGGMGLGDVKLIGAMGYTIGISITFETLIISMIICFIASLELLLTGKKKKKDSVAFGPFIYLGYTIAIIGNLI